MKIVEATNPPAGDWVGIENFEAKQFFVINLEKEILMEVSQGNKIAVEFISIAAMKMKNPEHFAAEAVTLVVTPLSKLGAGNFQALNKYGFDVLSVSADNWVASSGDCVAFAARHVIDSFEPAKIEK